MYDTILVPTDGSDHSLRAAEHGQYLAGIFDATLHVISAVDVESVTGMIDTGVLNRQFVDRLEEAGERAIEETRPVLDERGRVKTARIEGEPSEAILEYADDCGADLIAMGTHGRTGLNRYIAGSVTERVVRLADAPVLTVRATERSRIDEGYGEILVPADGSDSAEAAVDHGLAIAQRTDARVHTVNVVYVDEVDLSPNYTPPAELIERLESEGRAATERVVDLARERGLEVVTEIREGLPARDLLEYAEENAIDLIAMGTTGRRGLDRYLLGSTTEGIVRRADVPVLAVKRSTNS